MSIESSPIGIASQQASSRYFAIEETLHASVGTPPPNSKAQIHESRSDFQLTVATISEAARRASTVAQAGSGKDALSTAAHRGVSTLYLGNIASFWDPAGARNALQATARSIGTYLRQDGSAGSLQQIDIAV